MAYTSLMFPSIFSAFSKSLSSGLILINFSTFFGASFVNTSNLACFPLGFFPYPLIPIITNGGVTITVPIVTTCLP